MGPTHPRGPGAVVFAKVVEEGEGKGDGDGLAFGLYLCDGLSDSFYVM